MTEPPREWKQALEDLLKLSPERKWSKGASKHCNDADAQFDAVGEANGEEGKFPPFTKAICTQQEDKVSWCQVKIDVLQAQECSEKNAGEEKRGLVPGQHHGQNEYSIEEAIVLEMDMVDDQKARREQDRQCSCMGSHF